MWGVSLQAGCAVRERRFFFFLPSLLYSVAVFANAASIVRLSFGCYHLPTETKDNFHFFFVVVVRVWHKIVSMPYHSLNARAPYDQPAVSTPELHSSDVRR